MKKINFSRTYRLLFSSFLFAFLFLGSFTISAQTTNAEIAEAYIGEIEQNRIPALETLQSTFSATSAKWKIAQDAIDYYNAVITDLNNQNFDLVADGDVFGNDLVKKASEFTVLYNYTPAQLANFQTMYNEQVANGLSGEANDTFKKLEWTIEANSY